jgi:hypothetical protein
MERIPVRSYATPLVSHPHSYVAGERSLHLIAPQDPLKVNQWRFAVGHPADFLEPTPGVERTCASIGIKGVQANGIRGPQPGLFGGFVEQLVANSLALHVGNYRQLVRVVYPAPRNRR